MEIWKDIDGYEGLYCVSSYGAVGSLRRGTILKGRKDGRGYLKYALHKSKTRQDFSGHRLVACAFLDNSKKLPQVNHKDENKNNNRLDNLEWCDNKYNSNYGTKRRRLSQLVSDKMGDNFRGVHFNKEKSSWEGYIWHMGKKKSLGYSASRKTILIRYYCAHYLIKGVFPWSLSKMVNLP